MKIVVNLISVILFIGAASSVNSVNTQQQRPSQRPFVAVLSKLKEKKAGKNKTTEQSQPPVEKTNTSGIKNNA